MSSKDLDLSDLRSLADSAVRKTRLYGAEEAECYASWARIVSARIQGGLITLKEGVVAGAGLRAVIGRKVGFSSTTSLEEENVFEAAKRAVDLARIRPEDPKFRHLPQPIERPSRSGIFDEPLLSIDPTEVMEETSNIVGEAETFDPRITFVYGGVDAGGGWFAVANSRGVEEGGGRTGMGGGIYCKAVKNGQEKTGVEDISSRQRTSLSGAGLKAAERAIQSLGATSLEKPLTTTVILDNYTSTMITTLLGYGVSARSIQEGRSALQGKLNSLVATESLTIIDDAYMEDGLSTAKVDDEGIPPTRKPIIERGVLKNYLYNSYAAHLEDRKSTGNARRGGDEPFTQIPSVGAINYYIDPGDKPLEEMIAETDEGVLVRYMLMGVGHSNFISGDFSVVAPNAFLIQRGETTPIEPVTVGGNLYQALKKIVAVGSDLRLSGAGKIPSLKISDLKCASR